MLIFIVTQILIKNTNRVCSSSILTVLENACATDSECKNEDEFCDHTGINPIGSCRLGYANGQTCGFDRHCMSKMCHFFKCVAVKPVKDALCSKDHHEDCIESQYCVLDKQIDRYKCVDRICSGWCNYSAKCMSNSCAWYLRCKPTSNDSILCK